SVPDVRWSLASPTGSAITPPATMGEFQWPGAARRAAIRRPDAGRYTFSVPPGSYTYSRPPASTGLVPAVEFDQAETSRAPVSDPCSRKAAVPEPSAANSHVPPDPSRHTA